MRPLPAAAERRHPGLGPAVRDRRRPPRAALVRLPGYRGETERPCRASDDAVCASPCCARPRRPLPCSRRNPHASGERSPQARAGPWHRYENGRRGTGVRPGALVVPRSRSPRAASAGSRWAARRHDLTGIRRTGSRDPCCGGSPESRGRHGYASEDGSRGSSRDDGCSAGRCACSLGGSRNKSVVAGAVLAVTVRPRVARSNARVHRFPITRSDLCPSEAGGSSHRQLDLVTVRAAAPSGQTSGHRETLSTGWGQQLEPHPSP